MAIEAIFGIALVIPGIHPISDKFGTVACLGIAVLLLPGIWYGVWRVGSAESGETDPWKLDMLGVLAWVAVLATAVAVGVLLVP